MAVGRQPSTQTVGWFLDLAAREQLDLNPAYQRKSVWNQAYRDYFIDTVLNGFPMPPVFLNRETDSEGRTVYHVVDGRQRLETLIKYASNEFPTPDSYGPNAGEYFGDLPLDLKKHVWDYLVPVEFLSETHENVLKDIFDRINRNVAQLKPQELRHARFNGAFIQLTERLAERFDERLPTGFPNIIESERRRMRDVEYVANLLLFFDRGEQSVSQADLDEAYASWDLVLPADQDFEGDFIHTLAAVEQVHHRAPDIARSRYRNLADFYSLFAAVAELLPSG